MRLEHWWYTIPLRVRSIFRRAQVEQELEEELRIHFELLMAQEIAAGKTPDEARLAARLAMDGMEQQKEKCRDTRRVPHIENLVRDLRYGLRSLRKSPLFTAAIVGILALGIGANTAVFSIVDAVLLRPLPYKDSGRLVEIEESTHESEMRRVSPRDYLSWQSRTDLFDDMAAHLRDDVTVTGIGEPAHIIVRRASAGLFSMLGVHARLGRALVSADGDPKAPNAALLSDRLWRRLYQADPRIIGRTIRLSDEPYIIVGVMPPAFEFPDSNVEMWIPLRLTPAFKSFVEVVARIKPGLSIARVQSAMHIVARQIEREDPQENAGLQIRVARWQETPSREYELTLVFILAAVGLVLMIACVDVAGLLLSRSVQRQKEMAVRASLGAGFWQVTRQRLAESFALAIAGSVAGIVLARYTLAYLSRQIAALPIVLPHVQRVALDLRVLAFSSGLCLALACLISVGPMFVASKTDLQAVLRTGRAAGESKASLRLFSILIALQAGFAFLLLAGSGLMIRSLIRLEGSDHGFRPDHVLTMRVPVGSLRQLGPSGKYDTKPRQIAYYHELVEALHRVSGVKAVAVVNNFPLSGVNTSLVGLGAARTISPEYFSAIGTRLIAGRFFTDADQTGAPGVAITNERLAQQLFPGRYAVGQRLPGEGNVPGPTVVGVVANAAQSSYEKAPTGEVYLPYRQFIFGAFMSTIVVRTSGEPLALADTLKKAVWRVDPDQPIVNVETLSDVIADSIWRPRFSAWIFSVLAGLALVLTSAGVYGVVAYTTALRTWEIGIRTALGASPRDLMTVVLRGVMIPLACGLAVSVVAAALLSRLLASVLYEISGTDPVTYLGASLLLLGIGAMASVRPAWRAAVRDPFEVLKAE
jgi:predicted permease